MYVLLLVLNTLFITLFTGGLVYVMIGIVPLYLELSKEEFIPLHRRMDENVHPFMPLMGISSGITSFIELWFAHQPWQWISSIISIVGVLSIIFISEFHNVPLNRQFKAWTPDSKDDVIKMRAKWVRGYFLRTVMSGVVFTTTVLVPIVAFAHS